MAQKGKTGWRSSRVGTRMSLLSQRPLQASCSMLSGRLLYVMFRRFSINSESMMKSAERVVVFQRSDCRELSCLIGHNQNSVTGNYWQHDGRIEDLKGKRQESSMNLINANATFIHSAQVPSAFFFLGCSGISMAFAAVWQALVSLNNVRDFKSISFKQAHSESRNNNKDMSGVFSSLI